MKPNFALSLSPDGIQVLHRRATGWRLHNALRFSFGPEHVDADGVAIAERVAQILSRARDASG